MKKIFLSILLISFSTVVWSQPIRDVIPSSESDLDLKRVVIFTSGLAFYEYSGALSGPVHINFPFRLDAVNDVLKTLIINDPSSANPSVTYQSENTLFQTLRSLNIDLSNMPDLANILSGLRGVEIEITSPASHTGRIAGVEYRSVMSNSMVVNEPWLLLSTPDGIRQFNLKEINAVRFIDPVIEQDLNRALDLISSSRNAFSRNLLVNLPGTNRRNVSISYVIPSPVWKVSYRLDLGARSPLLQGWAIVDNDSDTDWRNVELSLVAGRPVSFIQMLYPPYHVSRPVLPLSIAGTAQAQAHERSAPVPQAAMSRGMQMEAEASDEVQFIRSPAPPAVVAGGALQAAAGADAGGQFEFTIRNPVSLDRMMSAMLPLVESTIEARRYLIYGGSGRHPRLGAEITNTTGMKLPAGPITVFDGGVYAGDALIEFWNENEKRLISFGEDLSVTAVASGASTRNVSTVVVSGGVMTITRNMDFNRTYTFVNSAPDSKNLIIEHTRTANTELVSPAASEQSAQIYRFNLSLPANRETVLTVSERRPVSENISLLPMRLDALLSYTTNQEIPANVRTAVQRAADLRRAADTADAAVRDIEAHRNRVIADQDRIRRNLEAAGNQTQQGQEYLRRLVALDSEIDAVGTNLERAHAEARAARGAFENYLNNLNL
jgi:hypothetical protein